MQTLSVLHTRALRACDCAATRALSCGSGRLESLAESCRDCAQRAYWRGDTSTLRQAIRTAASIGRRVRRAGAK